MSHGEKAETDRLPFAVAGTRWGDAITVGDASDSH
jgi:hypothetical protein